jgi:hypothetical protein
LRAISVCKTIGKCFFILPTDIATKRKPTDIFRWWWRR